MFVVKVHKWKQELYRQEREKETDIQTDRHTYSGLLMLIDGGTLLVIQFLGDMA